MKIKINKGDKYMNKITTLTMIGFMMVLLSPWAQTATNPPCPLPNDPNAILDIIWPLVDTNGDGGLSLAELSALYPVPEQYFTMFDTNRDGKVDRQEFQPIIALLQVYLPAGILSLVDTNGDALIQYEEVSAYVSSDQFKMLDRNMNGVIDCEDVGEPPIDIEGETWEGEIIIEGEIWEGEVIPPETNPCDWVDLAISSFDELDQNSDGVITKDELNFPIILIYPPIVDFDVLFSAFDLDSNGEITMEELKAWAEECGYNGGGDNGECPLPTTDIRSIIEIFFPLVDLDNNGQISKEEIEKILTIINRFLSGYSLNLTDNLDEIFAIADLNKDGGLSIEEIVFELTLLAPQVGIDPNNVLSMVDKNGNQMIDYDEVSQYLTEDQFASIDFNANGLIDCNDLNTVLYLLNGGWEGWEGEPSFEGEIPLDLCALGPIALEYFDMLDANKDGKITRDELITTLTVVYPIPVDPATVDMLFAEFDLDGDSAISREEIQTIIDSLCNIVIEGEPWPIEGEIDIPTDPCLIAPIVLQSFEYIDQNGDGAITLDEVTGPVIMIYPLPINQELIVEIFKKLDLNADESITKDELNEIIANCDEIIPIEGEIWPPIEGEIEIPRDPCIIAPIVLKYFEYIDQNGDGAITLDEITGLVSINITLPIDSSILTEIFTQFDLNADGKVVIEEVKKILEDCNIVPGGEGEVDIPDVWDPCRLAQYLLKLYGEIGQQESDLSIEDITNLISTALQSPIDMTWLTKAIMLLDLDANGTLTMNELQSIIDKCTNAWQGGTGENGTGGPGGPGGENQPTTLILERATTNNKRYWPGQLVTVILTIRNPQRLRISALGLQETLPTGWELQSIIETSGASVAPSQGATGTLEFAWMNIPPFPVKVAYTVLVPNDADGTAVFSGQVLYRTPDSEELRSPVCETVLLKGWAPEQAHSADSNRDWAISLTEMLRVIQMFNSGGYGCDETSEDGFMPGEGKHRNCRPHTADYRIQDWKIDLSELLRQIQLYNAPGKGYIIQEGTEDGFAPLLN